MVKDALAYALFASVTRMVSVAEVAEVGVPEITPVEPSMERPAGKVPE